MAGKSNLRNMSVSESTGKDVAQTGQLKNGARPTKAFTAKNKTEEYVSGSGAGNGPWGGKNAMK